MPGLHQEKRLKRDELKRMFNYKKVWATCGSCGIDHTGRGELCLACEDSLKEECVCEKGLPIHQEQAVDGEGQTIETAL